MNISVLFLTIVSAASWATFSRQELIKSLDNQILLEYLSACHELKGPEWCGQVKHYLDRKDDLTGLQEMAEEMDRDGIWHKALTRVILLRLMECHGFQGIAIGFLKFHGPQLLKDAVDYASGSIDSLLREYFLRYGFKGLNKLPDDVVVAFNALEAEDLRKVVDYIAPLLSDSPSNHHRVPKALFLNVPIPILRCQLLCLVHSLPHDMLVPRLEPKRQSHLTHKFVPSVKMLEFLETMSAEYGLDFNAFIACREFNLMYKLVKHTGPICDKRLKRMFKCHRWDANPTERKADFISIVHARWPDKLGPFMEQIDPKLRVTLMQNYPQCLAGMTLPPDLSLDYYLLCNRNPRDKSADGYRKRLIEIFTIERLVKFMADPVFRFLYSDDLILHFIQLAQS